MSYTFREARYRTIKFAPYLYKYTASLIPVEKPGMGTLAVDQKGRCYYDPAFLENNPIDVATAAILHETMHMVSRHHARSTEYLGETVESDAARRGNIATDVAVNQTVREFGLRIPDDWLTPERFGYPANLQSEEYFDLVPGKEDDENAPESPQNGSGQGDGSQGSADSDDSPDGAESDQDGQNGDESPDPGKGGGSGASDGQDHPWEDPAEGDGGPGELDDYTKQLLEREVAEDIERAASEGQGNIPGSLLRWAKQKLRPKANPYHKLRAAVRWASHTVAGMGDYTFRKFPRRTVAGGCRLPAAVQPVPNGLVIIDTSGSMGTPDLEKALGIVEQGLRHLPPGAITVICGDTEARSTQKVFSAAKVTLAGGGGTFMDKLIEDAMTKKPPYDWIVMVTDGETDWPAKKPRAKVVVALTRNNDFWKRNVPGWATVVDMTDK
jgi:predicted metal-dependent peptidase